MAVVTAYVDQVQKAYIAYYGRPADVAGLDFWTNKLSAAGGAWTSIIDAFGNSAEATGLLAGLTTAQKVNNLYQQMFGRDADIAGLTFYVNGINGGTYTLASIAVNIMNGTQAGTDATALANKLASAKIFTTAMDTTAEVLAYDGTAAAATARTWMTAITTTAATSADAIIATIGSTVNANGQTFTLTAGSDTGAAFAGGAGNDTYTAGVVQDGAGNLKDTLQAVDQLNGGGGTDTLNATLNSGAATIAPSLTSIENLVLRSTNAGSGLTLTGATGVEKITVANSTATAAVNAIGAVASLAVANQKTDVAFDGQTATTLALSLDTVGVVSATTPTQVKVDLGATAASKATTLNITTNASNVEVLDTAGANIATAATIAATGANTLNLSDGLALASLTVTGAGSVDVSSVALVKVNTLTVGDGGITFTTGNSTATTFSATTGAGKDKLTVDGDVVKTISTGAGDDSVTTATAALKATASIDLGAGNDTLTLGNAPIKGVTLNGGDGIDTFATTAAIYGGLLTGGTAFNASELAKISNFEVLKITDALVDASSFNVSAITGIGSFVAAAGVAGANTNNATVTGLAANASVTLAGDLGATAYTTAATAAAGKLSVVYGTDTTADTLNLTLNANYIENNDATATVAAATETVDASKVETLVVTSTGTAVSGATAAASAASPFLGAAGNKADSVMNTLVLTDDALVTLTVKGDQALTFSTSAAMTKLTTIDASANTAGVVIDASLAGVTSPALTITGTAKADTIKGGALGDTITLGGGNDTMDYTAGVSKIGTGKFDTITDFAANTYGNSAVTAGAAGSGAAADATKWTGDVLKFDGNATAVTAVVDVFTNAANATTFLANNANAANGIVAALDSSTGNLYIDNTADGVADFFISLTGVTTITAAAFQVV